MLIWLPHNYVPSISIDKKEELLSTHRLRKASEGSIDDDLMFGTDSDDSFTKDYEIPKETKRKESIIRRDESRFQREKVKRENKRLEKI